ncbi:amidohydrolase family protein [Pimelobacter sp. 30-1]|uniref:amidohydrolase family protein n=1 Tax=Pimelobacter sp. 30-1 TaxID=2004991 RepID=UPI001C0500CE|nr:amidohydrolase family protein [Pimelobacter sp. 30-1]MBU2696962.1 hypothetical protein [Pimelobacter sp. 30-1]
MRRLVTHTLVVTGDGILEDVDLLVLDGRVAALGPGIAATAGVAPAEVVDGRGVVVLPGLVNVHVHGVTPGPLMPSGGAALPRWHWLANLDRHLLQGTTAVLNLCGLATMDQVRTADRAHPVRVGGATTHEPLAVQAARAADGAGLSDEVPATTVAEQLAQGAVAIGELGGGQTLAGGGQDVVYLPAAFAERHGLVVVAEQARALKEAVLGRTLEWVDDPDLGAAADRVAVALRTCGLAGAIAPPDVVALVHDVVLPSLAPALAGIREGVRLAAEHGVPAFVHSAAVTGSLLTALAGEDHGAQVVACHVNHPSYLPEEAAAMVRRGRAAGWANEACVLDLLDRRAMVTTREHWDAVLDTGLVDVVATDYGPGGEHDGPLHAVRDLVDHGRLALAEAVALVSSAPADLVPGLTPARGRIVPGGPADLVLVDRGDLTRVREVLVGGESVVREGRTTYRSTQPHLSAAEFDRLAGTVGHALALRDEVAVAAAHHGLRPRVDALRTWVPA